MDLRVDLHSMVWYDKRVKWIFHCPIGESRKGPVSTRKAGEGGEAKITSYQGKLSVGLKLKRKQMIQGSKKNGH